MRTATPLDQPRAIGAARLTCKVGPRGSCIDGLRQSGALKLLFPAGRAHLEAILINTAGGITGGDRFEVQATAQRGSRLVMTTQAAERGYRATSGQSGRIRTHLSVEDDASFFWLPQETILYDGAAIERRLRVDLAASARFLMVEPILFGRRAMGEDVTVLAFRDHVDIRCAGSPIYRDGVRLEGAVARHLDRPAIAGGARAMASLVYRAPDADARLAAVREMLGDAGGASLLAPDLLVLRLLSEDGFGLRRRLVPILDLLTENTLPQSWRL